MLTIGLLSLPAPTHAEPLLDTLIRSFIKNPTDIYEEINRFPKPTMVRGIYMTSNTYASKGRDAMVDQLITSGGNAVTIDIEHGGGQLAFIPSTDQLKNLNPGSTAMNLKEMVDYFHQKNIYVIARNVVFKDPYMVARKPEWRIKTTDGGLWGGMGNHFLDPSNPGSQNYNLMVIAELAQAGVDEIQLDYIRFPSTYGYGLNFHYDEVKFTRADIINDFLRKAKKVTDLYGTSLSVDVFGGVVWGDVDWKIVGQHIPSMAEYVDVIYPMTYPSHFSEGFQGYYGFQAYPYKLMFDTIKRFVNGVGDHPVEVRMYVQGFNLKSPRFGPDYIQEQIQATIDAGGTGFMIWNAGNSYWNSWPIMGKTYEPQPVNAP